MSDKWDYRFIELAKQIATWSKDPSTKVGCVLVKDKRIIAQGYNGLPAGCSDELSLLNDREFKYSFILHAEENAILNAAKNGSSTDNSTAYITLSPCSKCSSLIVQAGIKRVVCPNIDYNVNPRFYISLVKGKKLLLDCGVSYDEY